MAKISNSIRKIIFEKAINKIYGDRLITEKKDFENNKHEIILKMVKRTAKKNGVDYDLLTTVYRPYVCIGDRFYYKTPSGNFDEELTHIFFNENHFVLNYEGAKFELVKEFKNQSAFYAYASERIPSTKNDEEAFSEAEKKEIIAVYKKYADFMKEVITSACAIRDVINSATTTKQLMETSPELGELVPETVACTALVPVETVNKVSALFRNR